MWFSRRVSIWFYRLFFRQIGHKSGIIKPLRIIGAQYISIGCGVTIDKFVYLYALDTKKEPEIRIDDNARIGHYCHIVALDKVHIERDVLIGDRVYIGDNNHNYKDISCPVSEQGVSSKATTVIGAGSWIADGVVIISSKVGKNCVIGANSVVTQDIPDYSVVVGNPAKIIKYYDPLTEKWINHE